MINKLKNLVSNHNIGTHKKEQGYKPVYPILIIPGLCSSGMQVEAGYYKWVGKRIWLSVKRMGKERLRLINTSKVRSYIDPSHPPITAGFLYVRTGKIFHKWEKKWFFFDAFRKALCWVDANAVNITPKENGVNQVTIEPGTEIEGYLVFNRFIKISYSDNVPKNLSSVTKSIFLENNDVRVTFSAENDQINRWRFQEIVKFIAFLYPDVNNPLSESSVEPESSTSNMWMEHMYLQEDGCSDPPGIRVRPCTGLNAVNYLDPGTFVKNASYVFGPIIDNLLSMGYDNSNLSALPYDWRIPPFELQRRDQYFTSIKNEIEQLYARTGKPVILLAHSMGNNVVRYFLQFMKSYPNADEWIDTHIHVFLALGAPWLGAPKAIRGVTTGDKMGLDVFITNEEAIKFSRRMGSSPWLFPNRPDLYFQDPSQRFAMMSDGLELKQRDIKEILEDADAQKVWELFESYYLHDPYYNDAVWLAPPPIKRLLCIYGVNLDTEVSFIAEHKLQKGSAISVDKLAKHSSYVTRDGVIYETSDTPQKILSLTNPNDDNRRAGDGTVPYASLFYPMLWKMDSRHTDMSIEIKEIEGAPHREILEDSTFINILLNCAAGRHIPTDEIVCKPYSILDPLPPTQPPREKKLAQTTPNIPSNPHPFSQSVDSINNRVKTPSTPYAQPTLLNLHSQANLHVHESHTPLHHPPPHFPPYTPSNHLPNQKVFVPRLVKTNSSPNTQEFDLQQRSAHRDHPKFFPPPSASQQPTYSPPTDPLPAVNLSESIANRLYLHKAPSTDQLVEGIHNENPNWNNTPAQAPIIPNPLSPHTYADLYKCVPSYEIISTHNLSAPLPQCTVPHVYPSLTPPPIPPRPHQIPAGNYLNPDNIPPPAAPSLLVPESDSMYPPPLYPSFTILTTNNSNNQENGNPNPSFSEPLPVIYKNTLPPLPSQYTSSQ